MKMKKLIVSTILAVSAIVMLSSCVDPTEDSSVNISGDLTWDSVTGIITFVTPPNNFVDTSEANPTPITIKLTGDFLSNSNCVSSIKGINVAGVPSTPANPRSFQSFWDGSEMLDLGTASGFCGGLSGEANIAFIVGGKKYSGTISQTF